MTIPSSLPPDLLTVLCSYHTKEARQAFFESCNPEDQDYLRRAIESQQAQRAKTDRIRLATARWIEKKAAYAVAQAELSQAAAEMQVAKLAAKKPA